MRDVGTGGPWHAEPMVNTALMCRASLLFVACGRTLQPSSVQLSYKLRWSTEQTTPFRVERPEKEVVATRMRD